jgi:hypothetical protein
VYLLKVAYRDAQHAHEMVQAQSAEELLDLIPKLISNHTECERIEVLKNSTRLFSVSCMDGVRS